MYQDTGGSGLIIVNIIFKSVSKIIGLEGKDVFSFSFSVVFFQDIVNFVYF